MAEGQVASSEEKLNFDDNTLKAIANVYREEGNNEYRKRELSNAVYFYTEGIQVNCKDDELNAKLYSNRATANFYLGNYQETLNDASAAVSLKPTYIKAIERGASACVKLHRYKEAVTWCDKGLAIDKKNKTLLDLRTRCLGGQNTSQESMSITHLMESQQCKANLPKAAKEVGCNVEETTNGDVTNVHNTVGDLNSAIPYLELTSGNPDATPYRLQYLERELKIAKEVGDTAREGRAYHNFGNAYKSLRNFKTAIEYYERCLEIVREVGDTAAEGRAYGNLGNAYESLGNFKTAIECYERCLKIAREVGDTAAEGRAYNNLGVTYEGLGDFKTAIEYYERCLIIVREVGDKAAEGRTYGNLGIAYEGLGDFKKAIEYQKRCLKIARKVGDKAEEGRAYGHLGIAYEGLRDFKAAIEYYERCLKIVREVGDKAAEGILCNNLGNAFHSLRNFKTAIDYHERCLEISREVGNKAAEGSTYGNLGKVYQSLGNFKAAIEYHERCLEIVREVGDKAEEGSTYGNLGKVYQSLGNFKTAIEYHERCLEIVRELGDTSAEGRAYGNLGNAYESLGNFKTAIEYHERCLLISRQVGDIDREGTAYCNLGTTYFSLGNFKTAIEYHERCLLISRQVGDKAGEGTAYGNLGTAYQCLGKFKTALEYHERSLEIIKEVGNKANEGRTYANLGNAYQKLKDFKTAIDYYKRSLKIAKEVGNKVGEGTTYCNIGNSYGYLGDFKTAIEYHKCCLEIVKEAGNKAAMAASFYGLGGSFELQGSLLKALDCYHSSVRMFNEIRSHLQHKDEWKINYRDMYENAYTSLWRLSLRQGKTVEALYAADQGRAQALNDLLELNYGFETAYDQSNTPEKTSYDSFSFLPSTAVFIAIDKREIVFWVVQNGNNVQLRRKEISDSSSLDSNSFLKSLAATASEEIGVRAGVKCEDRSLDNLADKKVPNERSPQSRSIPFRLHKNVLRTFYDIIIGPISDLVRGKELILVPEGPLCLAPYAAFKDPDSKYLCEFCRIRMIPSLTSLKLITECPDGYHSKTGVLLVGDPWVQEVVCQGEILKQLPCAREEVEMIGRLLNTEPLIGREAAKDEVLRRLSSVALVHIAAHGRMETGEIALAPNTTRTSQIPVEEDFILTMNDVMSVQIRARLVVLSCCHSGRGEVKAEGVVGIARAFLGAGARSVLVSLWAIDDEATMEFMRSFYSHLAEGRSASESLNQAMKCMRESDEFNEVKYWAPFVLIGDDVTLEFGGSE